ncbi:TrmH family RNA methyltransferase [Flavobacterium sp. ST-75]|uniref:TrmH family RNA methyltransferase n=1 Tax=Flavobacterium rhizophilum TaxID=3163296 RepID=A0ABW8YFT7_9FLAO
MSQQLTHNESVFSKKTFPVTLVCDNIVFQPNIGSLFRIAEAFGVSEIIFVGEDIALTPRKINRTSRSTHNMVKHRVIEKTEDVINLISQTDSHIVALEITNKSIPLTKAHFSTDKPIVLIAGSEISGISESFLKVAHQAVHIEMFGDNSSMNVVQAVGIALYDITSKIG